MAAKCCSGLRRTATGQRGSATAELAIALPAVTALLALLLLGVSAGLLQLRLEEGARAGARALARGDAPAQVVEIVERVAGHGASVTLGNDGGYATVTVLGRAGGVLSGLVPWEQEARASTRSEPTSGPKPGGQNLPGSNVAAGPTRGRGAAGIHREPG